MHIILDTTGQCHTHRNNVKFNVESIIGTIVLNTVEKASRQIPSNDRNFEAFIRPVDAQPFQPLSEEALTVISLVTENSTDEN